MNRGYDKDFVEIDIMRLIKALLRKVWLIIILLVIGAVIGGSYAKFFLKPTYKSSTMLYVNTSSVSVGPTRISLAELNTSATLIKTYETILRTRNVLKQIAENTNLGYSYQQIGGMLSTSPIESTAIFTITVTTRNPDHAPVIANEAARVLSKEIDNTISGTSSRVIEDAIRPAGKSGPNSSKYVVTGALVGAVLAAGFIIILELSDDIVHDEEYLVNTFNIPVLASIPDLTENIGSSSYGAYGSNTDSTAVDSSDRKAKN